MLLVNAKCYKVFVKHSNYEAVDKTSVCNWLMQSVIKCLLNIKIMRQSIKPVKIYIFFFSNSSRIITYCLFYISLYFGVSRLLK